MSLSGFAIYENENPNLIDFIKEVNNSNKICLYCHTNNPQWTKYELKCGDQMHSRCARKYIAEKGGVIHCPKCGEIQERISNMYCRECNSFGHYMEKCRKFFESMDKEQMPVDIVTKYKYFDIQQKYNGDTRNQTCIFCHEWALGDDGSERWFSIQGDFIVSDKILNRIKKNSIKRFDIDIEEDGNVLVLYCCTDCFVMREEEIDEEGGSSIWFQDVGRFIIDCSLRQD